jgi:hypothetical protein
MSFKLKALALAAAAIAAGPANAAIDTFASGNGELFFSVHDDIAQKSFVFDLTGSGLSMNDFLPNYYTGNAAYNSNISTAAISPAPVVGAPSAVEASGYSLTFDIDALAEWNTFVANTNSANWEWNVIAGDSTGSTGILHQVRYLTTSNSDLGAVDNITSTQLNSMKNIDTGYVVALNTKDGGASPDFSDYNDNSVPGDVEFGAKVGDNWQNLVGAGVSSTLGDSMNFYYVTGRPAGTVGAAQFGNEGGAATWTFRQVAEVPGQYELVWSAATVAEIPEPSTWAMLSAGLLALGFIARRRVAG